MQNALSMKYIIYTIMSVAIYIFFFSDQSAITFINFIHYKDFYYFVDIDVHKTEAFRISRKKERRSGYFN